MQLWVVNSTINSRGFRTSVHLPIKCNSIDKIKLSAVIASTVDREFFAVKIFSSLAVATKIRHAKIWHAMLYQLHGWANDEDYLTRKFNRQKFPDLRYLSIIQYYSGMLAIDYSTLGVVFPSHGLCPRLHISYMSTAHQSSTHHRLWSIFVVQYL